MQVRCSDLVAAGAIARLQAPYTGDTRKVIEGLFTFVALDDYGRQVLGVWLREHVIFTLFTFIVRIPLF